MPEPKPMRDCVRCHHPWESHQHWRNGEDCGICGRDLCRVYRRWMPGPALAVVATLTFALIAWGLGKDGRLW